MSYLDSLSNGEEILARTRRSKIIFADTVFFAILAIIFAVCVFYFNWFSGEDATTRLVLAFIPVVIVLLLLVFDIISYIEMEIAVTDTRIFGKDGLISKTTLNIPINNVSSVKVEMSFFGTMFNYGNLKIMTPSGEFSYEKMNKPIAIRDTIVNLQIQKAK